MCNGCEIVGTRNLYLTLLSVRIRAMRNAYVLCGPDLHQSIGPYWARLKNPPNSPDLQELRDLLASRWRIRQYDRACLHVHPVLASKAR